VSDVRKWKLVPVEPTPEMLEEICIIEGFTEQALKVRYAAMLAAAPVSPRAQLSKEEIIEVIESAIRDASRGADTYMAAMIGAEAILAAADTKN
jgi:hypothetical protein